MLPMECMMILMTITRVISFMESGVLLVSIELKRVIYFMKETNFVLFFCLLLTFLKQV